jgi:superfamily II DNA or RNA helicase
MKILNRNGYIINKDDLDDEELENIKKDLTVKPIKLINFGKVTTSDEFTIYSENDTKIGLPRHYGIEKYGNPDINMFDKYNFPKYKIKYTGTLRPRQEIIVNNILEGFDKYGGGLLIAGCGSGKTNMAIYIACVLGLKTLFLVHKTFLKNQAIDRIKTFTNCKKVGTIQGNKTDVDHPFVIGMIQSIAKRHYDKNIFKDFGLVIIDEAHHMGAKMFSRIFLKLSTPYMLGITAETTRNDGLYKILNLFIGPILHEEPQAPNNKVIVKIINFFASNTAKLKEIFNRYTRELDTPTMITNLTLIKSRNDFIYNMIIALFNMDKNILILSERVKQLDDWYLQFESNQYTQGNVGLYLGRMKEKQLEISKTKQIILATYQMAEEGLDIENLNAIILATPKSKVRQSIGRILRKDTYDYHPIVIDIVDNNDYYKRKHNNRQKYYRKQKYNMHTINIYDNKSNTDSNTNSNTNSDIDSNINNDTNSNTNSNTNIEVNSDTNLNTKSRKKKNNSSPNFDPIFHDDIDEITKFFENNTITVKSTKSKKNTSVNRNGRHIDKCIIQF